MAYEPPRDGKMYGKLSPAQKVLVYRQGKHMTQEESDQLDKQEKNEAETKHQQALQTKAFEETRKKPEIDSQKVREMINKLRGK